MTGLARGFSMTELLVVIGIIAVLAGVLLVAMGGVRKRALYTQTLSTMNEFAKACEAFQIEHGQYPGVIPEPVLAAADPIQISGTENALLHLMGGYRVVSPFDDPNSPAQQEYDAYIQAAEDSRQRYHNLPIGTDGWQIMINIDRIGEGPVINGRQYAPYYTPTLGILEVAVGQRNQPVEDEYKVPDLMDAWGHPIVYARRARTVGPLCGKIPGTTPQFYYQTMTPYTEVAGGFPGHRTANQDDPKLGSLLVRCPDTDTYKYYAQMIRHPSFGALDDPLNGTPRGGFVLLSAGPDGYYFSIADGPGEPKDQKRIGTDPDWEKFHDFGPGVYDDFDDIRVFGGG